MRYVDRMQCTRLPRFKRAPTVAPLELTARDREIIRLVHRHRFLRSPQIVALAGGSPQQVSRRLALLYHHGYLERPRCQLDYYHQGGSRHIVYGLGNKGGLLLKREMGSAFRPVVWGAKNRVVGRVYLEHALLVSEVMVAIELACRRNGCQLVTAEQLSVSGHRSSFRWQAEIGGGVRLGLIPDQVFALDRNGTRAFFFMEADRGTMPVMRKNLVQTSLYRKLLAYTATWEQSIHQTRFGFNRFRVLFLTKSQERVKSLVDACGKLKRGHGLFLIADRTILNEPDILSSSWQTGRPGQTGTLLD